MHYYVVQLLYALHNILQFQYIMYGERLFIIFRRKFILLARCWQEKNIPGFSITRDYSFEDCGGRMFHFKLEKRGHCFLAHQNYIVL